MKYFTIEFYYLEVLSYTNRYVKESKQAERKDEAFYQQSYEKKFGLFLKYETADGLHGSPTEDACRAEEILESKFKERQTSRIQIYSRLPQKILEKIADIRVFALGFASAEAKRMLRPYCAKLRRIIQKVRYDAYTETNEAEAFLAEELFLNDYNDVLIRTLKERNGNVYLNERNNGLVFVNGEIIEGSMESVYPYHEEDPNSPWSRIIAAELHRTDGLFEAHFLVMNCDETERDDFRYLTIRGSEIRRI